MPNFLPTHSYIADKTLEFLWESSGVLRNTNRSYESSFQMTPNAIGKTVQVKQPPRYTAADGPAISSLQPTNMGLESFSVDKWKTVPMELSGEEMTFNSSKDLDIWAERNIKPAIAPIVSAVEDAIFSLYSSVPNIVGTAGTGPTTQDVIGQAMESLSIFETPQDMRVCCLSPTGARKFISGTTVFNNSGGAFNPQMQLGEQFMSGQMMGRVAGFDMIESNKVVAHTVGSATSTGSNILVNVGSGNFGTGSSIPVDAFTTGTTLKAGDVITFATLYSVNPITKKSTGQLRKFVITADVTAAGNAATLSISPPIIPSGAFQNVTGATGDVSGVADNTAVAIVTGTASTAYQQNLAWWKDAIGLVCVPVAPLTAGVKSATRNYEGLSITVSEGSDIMNYKSIRRIDCAFGVKVFSNYQDQVVRITG